MNDKLWKTIQYLSIILCVVIAVGLILVSDFEKKPDGHWQAIFPNKAVQYTAVSLLTALIPTFAFATVVRREEEVSFRIVQQTIISIIGWVLFYLLIRYVLF